MAAAGGGAAALTFPATISPTLATKTGAALRAAVLSCACAARETPSTRAAIAAKFCSTARARESSESMRAVAATKARALPAEEPDALDSIAAKSAATRRGRRGGCALTKKRRGAAPKWEWSSQTCAHSP